MCLFKEKLICFIQKNDFKNFESYLIFILLHLNDQIIYDKKGLIYVGVPR
jgi:hypothetical protein